METNRQLSLLLFLCKLSITDRVFSLVLYRCCRVDHYAVFGDPAILCCHGVVPLNDASVGKHISRKIVNCISFLKVDKIKTVEQFRLLIHAQYNKQHHRKVLFSSFHSNIGSPSIIFEYH